MLKFVLGSADTKICGPAKMDCYFKAMSFNFQTGQPKECNCLPSCTTLFYSASAIQSGFNNLNLLDSSSDSVK